MRSLWWVACWLCVCLAGAGTARAEWYSGPDAAESEAASPSQAAPEPVPGSPRADAPVQRINLAESDPELRYTGGWMFAVGLPTSIIGGVAALQASGDGPLAQRQIATPMRITGTTLFAAGTAAWTVGLALWFVGRQPVTMLPTLSVGPSGTFVRICGETGLFGGR